MNPANDITLENTSQIILVEPSNINTSNYLLGASSCVV